MSLTEGLDPERVREIAGRLADQGARTEDVSRSGTSMLRLLQGVWEGPDLEDFSRRWELAVPRVDEAAQGLRATAADLERQAADQEAASDGGGGTQGSPQPVAKDEDKPWWEDAWDGITDFGEDLLELGEDVVDTVGDGLEWLGDRVEDGLDWLGDRVEDAVDWVGSAASSIVDFVKDAVRPVVDSFTRFTDQLGNVADVFMDAFAEGRFPSYSEVVASSILAGAAFANFLNTLQGRDIHTLDDGTGTVGEHTDLSLTESVDGHPPLREPSSLDEILRSTTDAYQVDGTVRITTVTQPDGTTAYIVNTPGTESWSPNAGDNPLDLTGNLAAMSEQPSAAMEAVTAAMEAAGIPPDAPVLLVGHSQGGIINTALISDPAFTDRFNVTHSVTYGSPVDTFDTDQSVQQLNIQHESDLVPMLDLGDASYVPGNPFPVPNPEQAANGNGPSATTVTLPNPGAWYDPAANHDHSSYADSVAASDDPAIAAYEASLSAFLAQQGTEVSGSDYEVVREH